MKKTLFLAFLVLTTSYSHAQMKLSKLWETHGLATPESVLPLGNLLYVSLIDGDGATADGKGGVAILNSNGKIVNKDWVAGLNAPKGMGISNGKMYVADINEVVKIDMKTAKVEAKIPIKESVFLNDIAVDDEGKVFVSDTRSGKIYSIINDKVELYLDEMKNANGLKVIKGNLYVLSGPKLLKVDKNKKVETVASGFASGGDGLEPYGKDEFIVTCWVGLIFHVKADGTFDLLMDSRADKINTADIGFNAKKNILYLPTFLKNSVVAYKVH